MHTCIPARSYSVFVSGPIFAGARPTFSVHGLKYLDRKRVVGTLMFHQHSLSVLFRPMALAGTAGVGGLLALTNEHRQHSRLGGGTCPYINMAPNAYMSSTTPRDSPSQFIQKVSMKVVENVSNYHLTKIVRHEDVRQPNGRASKWADITL